MPLPPDWDFYGGQGQRACRAARFRNTEAHCERQQGSSFATPHLFFCCLQYGVLANLVCVQDMCYLCILNKIALFIKCV